MKKRSGFTLIELLAVIVILGLLMAIAIPSVTKYITQSRKKTVASTIGNYMSALTTQVNNMDYTFTDSNTIYAVPIECISLERGGTNPFGKWHQANRDYFAYVLVKYDDVALSYTYGFTFKDSSGYGIYPTTIDKLDEGGTQIETGLSLSKPRNGTVEKITNVSNWNGFEVDENTKLKVLKAELEGVNGNGDKTCTLKQKGANYETVNYQIADKDKPDKELPILTYASSAKAFWQPDYRLYIKTITFEDYIDIPNDAFKSWDMSSTGNGMVMAYIKKVSEGSKYYNLYIQGDRRIYANKDSAYLFWGLDNLDSINNIEILDTSRVTDMTAMFSSAGFNSSKFTLDLGDNFDTSNVVDMDGMFSYTGYKSSAFTLNLGDKFDTSKVKNMSGMFYATGYYSNSFKLDCSNWNVSNVTNYENFNAYSTKKVKMPAKFGS